MPIRLRTLVLPSQSRRYVEDFIILTSAQIDLSTNYPNISTTLNLILDSRRVNDSKIDPKLEGDLTKCTMFRVAAGFSFRFRERL